MSGTSPSSTDFGLRQELNYWRERCKRTYGDSSVHRLIQHFQIKGFDESALVVGAIQSELEDNMDKKSGCRRILSECAKVHCLEYVLQMAAKEKFDFYGVWDTKSPNCSLAFDALFLGMYKEFRILLRYGFSPEAIEKMGTSEPATASSFKNIMSTRLVYETMYHLLFAKENGLMEAGKGIFLSFLQLSKTTSSIPISVQELAEYSQTVQNSKYSIYQICSAYMDLFPSLSLRPNTPHSRQHFSRCKVRRCLGEAKKPPGRIHELNSHVNLKRYLDLLY